MRELKAEVQRKGNRLCSHLQTGDCLKELCSLSPLISSLGGLLAFGTGSLLAEHCTFDIQKPSLHIHHLLISSVCAHFSD